MARGRPATPPGTYGAISKPKQLPNGVYQTSTRLRLFNGRTVRIRATGKTPTKAEQALKERCTARLQGDDNDELRVTSTISSLMKLWIAQHDVTDSSKETYQKCIDMHINPGVGNLRLNEFTAQRAQHFLGSLTPGTARTARAALGSACGLAVRWGVMPRNPVRDTKLKKKRRNEVRVLTDEEIQEYRDAVEKWCGSNTSGTKRGESLLEIVDVLRGSGMRIGEVLALRWNDVDLEVGTLTIRGTVDNKGGRKSFPKTETSRRTIPVKECALQALKRQCAKEYRPYFGEIVFPTRNGTYRTVPNVSGDLKKARGDLDIHAHDFRKTAATRIEEKHGVMAASRYLGHSSTSVTEQSYLARPSVLPDYTDAF